MNKSKKSRVHNDSRVSDLFAEDVTVKEPVASVADHAMPDDSGREVTDGNANEARSGETASVEMGFGARLRTNREGRDLDITTCAQALHLPTRVLRKLETDDYAGIDSHVYLHSYLRKYGDYLGVPRSEVDTCLDTLHVAQPALVSSGGIPRSRYLLERYATAATYLVLTAVIVVPIVWIGLKGGLNQEVARLAPLDSAPVATSQGQIKSSATPDAKHNDAKAAANRAAFSSDQPLQASLAPFSALDNARAMSTPVTPPMAMAIDAGRHSLTLTLPAKSWVEIIDADGQRLEYGLLPAGTHKTWSSSDALKVSIGNAAGATVSVDGKALDLQPYQHANVARFQVQIDNGKAVPQAM